MAHLRAMIGEKVMPPSNENSYGAFGFCCPKRTKTKKPSQELQEEGTASKKG